MIADNTQVAPARPRGGFQAPVPDDVLTNPVDTYEAYQKHIDRTGLSPRTIRSYGSQVRRFAEWMATRTDINPVEAFTDPYSRDYAVRDYRAELTGRDLAPASIDAALAAADSFYVWLGLGKANVTRTKDRNSTQFGEGLDDSEVTAVMRAAERRGPRDLAIVGLFLMTGPRLSELAGVNVDDWWAQERSGSIRYRGKGSKIRDVPLPSPVRPLLLEWRKERAKLGLAHDFAPFFVTGRGDRLASRSVSHMVGVVGKSAGLAKLHPHQLRHTFAVKQLENGRTIAEVQSLLGHSSISSTQIYLKPTAAALSERADAWKVEW